MLIKQKNTIFYGMIVWIIFSTPAIVSAIQPVDVIAKSPDKYIVRQGSAQCGPASFYIVFKYYGDHLNKYPFYYDSKGSPVDLSGTSGTKKTSSMNMENIDIIRDNSPVSAWIKGDGLSTDWIKIIGGIKNLYSKSEDGSNIRYYTVVESCDSVTGIGKKDIETRSKNFIDRIVPQFIEKNKPVIIHLKRKWPFAGHYIVLIGYDPVRGVVSYLDPNGDRSVVVHTVLLNDFLNTYWYKGANPSWWSNACWSGKWVGFYRTDVNRKGAILKK